LIDAHAHLTDGRFAGELDEVVHRAGAAGVTRILTCGEDLASSERAIAVAERYTAVRVAVGVHPHRADTLAGAAGARLRELARHERVVGIGEIGIDLSGRSAPRSVQEDAFRAQVELAAELDLPVTIHVRDAGEVVRDLLGRLTRVRGHVHCYSEGPEAVDRWMSLGLLLSFAGTVTYPASERLRAAAAIVPIDRILIETDSPYLAPQPRRGRRNEPAFVADTYDAVAAIRGLERAELAEAVRDNAATLFGGRW
jgi:TatD DNase family protein